MTDVIQLDGIAFIPLDAAAHEADLSSDYLYRLSRNGTIASRIIGRRRYVEKQSLQAFLIDRAHRHEEQRVELAKQRAEEYARRSGAIPGTDIRTGASAAGARAASSGRSGVSGRVVQPTLHGVAASAIDVTKKAIETTRAIAGETSKKGSVVTNAFNQHGAKLVEGMRESMSATGMGDAALRAGISGVHVPLYTVTPVMEFVHKLIALTLAFMLTFGTYSLVDPQYAKFALSSIESNLSAARTSYVSFTHGGVTKLASNADAQLAAAAENPAQTLARATYTITNAVPQSLATLAKSINSSVNGFVYAVAFPDALVRSPVTGTVDVHVTTYQHTTIASTGSGNGTTTSAGTSTSTGIGNGTSGPVTVIQNPVIERIVEKAVPTVAVAGGITEAELNARLQQLDNKLSSQIFAITAQGSANTAAIGSNYQSIATTQHIDQLSGVAISGGTIDGANITNSSIAATSLSVSGNSSFATTTISNLTVTGDTTLRGTLSIPGALSISSSSIELLTATYATTATAYITTASTTNLTWENATGTNAVITNATTTNSATFSGTTRIADASATSTGKLYFGENGARIFYNSSDYTLYGGSVYTNAGRIVSIGNSETIGLGVRYVNGDGTYYLGASHSFTPDLIFTNTGNVERARLTDGGFFGIGTSSPFAALSVAGDGYFTSGLTAATGTFTSATTTNFFSTNASTTNATSTNLYATVGSFDSLSVGASNSSGLATFGGGLISQASSTIGNGTQAGGLTISGGATTTGSAYVGGDLTVAGSMTTLGTSTSNLLVVNSAINSNLIPNGNKTFDLGSPSYYWRNGYIDTITVNNISAASTSIGGTASNTFTINSDNATADAEDMSLIFFRGTVVPNALLSWNSAAGAKRFEFNQPLYISNQSGSTTQTTLTLKAVAGQTGKMVDIQNSSGSSLFSIGSDGATTVGGSLTVNGSLTSTMQASTTLFSSLGTAYFGTTATTTIDQAGNVDVAGNLLVNGTTNLTGLLSLNVASTSQLSIFQKAYFGGTATSSFDSTGFLTLVNGFNSQASSTIGNGTQTGGLTISGGATTTGSAYFGGNVAVSGGYLNFPTSYNAATSFSILQNASSQLQFNGGANGYAFNGSGNASLMTLTNAGNLGIGTTTPWTKFAIHANNGETATTLFSVASSTASATTTLLSLSNAGKLSIQGSDTSGNGAILELSGSKLTGISSGLTIAPSLTTGRIVFDVNSDNGGVSVGAAAAHSGYFSVVAENRNGGGDAKSVYLQSQGTNSITDNGGSVFIGAGGGNFGLGPSFEHNGSVVFGIGNDGTEGLQKEYARISSLGSFGLGTSTPWGKLSVSLNNGDINPYAFVIASSTASATTTLFAINNIGNVGIGTTSPASRLTIDSAGNSTNPFLINSSTGNQLFRIRQNDAGHGALQLYDNSGTAWAVLSADSATYFNTTGNVGIGTTTPWAQLSLASVAGSPAFAIGSTTTQFIVDKNGNVGLGVANPGAKLDVEGGSIWLGDRGDSFGSMFRMIGGSSKWDIYNQASNGMFRIYQASNAAGSTINTDRFVIDQVGNVGIGASAPDATLEVATTSTDATTMVGHFYAPANPSGTSYTTLRLDKGLGYGGEVGGFLQQGVASGLVFNTVNSGTASEAMRILNNGYVGIGTTSPSTNIAVQGNALFSGDLSLANLTATGTITTASLKVSGVTSALHLADSSGNVTAYSGSSCTNQFVRSLNGAGVATCATVSLTADVTGTLPIANGGTGTTVFSTGGVVFNVGSNLSSLVAVATGNVLISQGTNLPPAWGKVGLTTHVSGTLPIANGGTNGTSQTSNGVNYFDGTKITSGSGLTFTGTNFGVGTTSPATTFSLGGNAYLTGGLGVGVLNTTAGTAQISGSANTLLTLRNTSALTATGINFGDTSGTSGLYGSNGDSWFTTGGATALSSGLLTIKSSGNVGIGTTTPRATLDVFKSYNAGTDTFRINAGDSAADYWLGIQSYAVGSGNVGYKFRTNNGATTNDTLALTGAGNVGIGTTSPVNKLNVESQTASTFIGVESPLASQAGFSFRDNTNGVDWLLYKYDGAGQTRDLNLWNPTNGSVMTFTNGAKVGVGTTTPFRKLSVTDTVSAAQVAIAYDGTRYTQQQTDASGDFHINASGQDTLLDDSNMWVCSGGACPTGNPTGTGNLIVENKIGIGTSSPGYALDVLTSTNVSQAHFGSVADGGAYILSTAAHNGFFSTGSAFNGTNWVAKSTTATIIGGGSGIVQMFTDSALTTGSTYAPTERLRIDTSGNVGIGTTTPSKQLSVQNTLYVGANGATGLGTATSTFQGDIKITGKLDVSTIDPPYTIDGTKYATYAASMTGVKEETAQTLELTQKDANGKYAYTINFDDQEKGGDLWLFYQVTDFGAQWQHLTVLLTPSFDGAVFYKKVPEKHQLIVYADQPGEVSMRLTGNRYDFTKWGNIRPDQDGNTEGTHVISSKPTINQAAAAALTK